MKTLRDLRVNFEEFDEYDIDEIVLRASDKDVDSVFYASIKLNEINREVRKFRIDDIIDTVKNMVEIEDIYKSCNMVDAIIDVNKYYNFSEC